MPANGLVYTPPHPCACYMESKTNGFSALAKESPEVGDLGTVPDAGRLERGAAYGRASALTPASADDWPTYRADGARSGHAKGEVPERLASRWRIALGRDCRLTAPVVCGGKVFVADRDSHTLFALDTGTGEIAWRFRAGGRIDSPPTIHDGLALFGCRDGWVYALRAADGELAWRFRGAPVDRRMTAFDQVESVWPIHGSVLVQDGALYCVAGRLMFLDGGLRLLKLDTRTGGRSRRSSLTRRTPRPARACSRP